MKVATVPSASLIDLSRRGFIDAAGVLAQHEGAHAVVALFVGMGVKFATIAKDALDGGGLVQLDGKTDPGFGHLVAIMAGPIGTGDAVQWKPLDVGTGDEAQLAGLVDYLNLDEDAWHNAEYETRKILEIPHVARAWRAISGSLYDRRTLDGDELKRLYDEAK